MGKHNHAQDNAGPMASPVASEVITLDALLETMPAPKGRGNGGLGTFALNVSKEGLVMVLGGKYAKTFNQAAIVSLLQGNRDTMAKAVGCTDSEAATIRNILVGARSLTDRIKGKKIVSLSAALRWQRVYTVTDANGGTSAFRVGSKSIEALQNGSAA